MPLFNPIKAGKRIATRFPTAKAATEDPFTQDLIIDTQAMIDSGEKPFATNASAASATNAIRTNAKKPSGQVATFQDQVTDNLLWLYSEVPVETREATKNWYLGANKIANELATRYGGGIDEASGVIAALSPQKDWYQNVSLADRVYSGVMAGQQGTRLSPEHLAKAKELYEKETYQKDIAAISERPFAELSDTQKAMWVRSYDETYNDRGYDIISPVGQRVGRALTNKGKEGVAAWGSNVEIAKAIRVIEDPSIENISRQMGTQHKVRNFYNNIADPNSDRGDVTIDTHAVAAGLLKPLSGTSTEVAQNFGSGAGSASSAVTGAKGTFGLHADAYRNAASQLGILPRELQSVTWEAIRNVFPRSFKTQSNVEDISSVWDLHQRGKITRDQARNLIMERAGGMAESDWAKRPDSGGVAGGSPVDEGSISGSSIPRTGGVDTRVGLVASGIPAIWLGLASEEAEAAPFGTLARSMGIPTRKAFHGSPHDFDEFSLSKIGTGEGAQVYGHGLYFSSEKEIAKYYRDQLSEMRPIEFKGRPVNEIWTDGIRERWDDVYKGLSEDDGYDMDVVISNLTQVDELDQVPYVTDGFNANQMRLFREVVEPELVKPEGTPGKLYTVEIPDESNMLDWDKPLSEQPESVRETMDALLNSDRFKDNSAAQAIRKYDMRGEQIYDRLLGQIGRVEPADASAYLKEQGIPGITYKGATSGERNFVVFDDEMINTVEKGRVDPKLLPAIAAGGAAGEFARRRSQKKTFSDQLKNTGQEMSVLAAALGAGVMSELAKGAVMFNNLMPSRGMDMGTALEQANQAGDLVNEGMMGALPNFLQPEETPILDAIGSGVEEIADRTTSSLDWLQRTGVLSEDARRVLEAVASEL